MAMVAESHREPDISNSNSIENGTLPALGDTISRSNSGSVASTMGDGDPCISCTTFNILAPIFKRLHKENDSIRESDFRALWLARNQKILDCLLCERSSIICLQEFWVGNEELVHMYEESLGDAGYDTFRLARTNDRGDGLLTAVHKDCLRVLNYRELLFNDFGDKVVQLLHVQSILPFPKCRNGEIEQEILIVNTHLLFPYDSSLSIVRLHQVYKIVRYLETYQRENKLGHIPIMLCGDWNGSKRGHVYKFLRSQGFVSSFDIAHQYTDSDADAHKWISHRNHRGNICGVDFIWLRNPSNSRKSLKASWKDAVFGVIKYQRQKVSLAENDASAFPRVDKHDNLIGLSHGVSFQQTKDLWMQADIDDGVLDRDEFKRIWNPTWSEQIENSRHLEDSEDDIEEEAMGFAVKNAVLSPREAEKGIWPENYSLSDHARLTVVFTPMKIHCSQPLQ